jgi:hypothetical protein
MPGWLKGLLTIVLWTAVPAGVLAAVLSATGLLHQYGWTVAVTAIFGLLYGIEAGVLTIYDLGDPVGWVMLLVDMTWSLPNTVWGFVVGNLIFWFFGSPSRTDSADQGWIVFQPRGGGGFGNHVLQTHGTVNLGGAGQHERMHLLQARVFGPLFLPLYLLFYVVTTLIQLLWTGTFGWILVLTGTRPKAPLQPPATSVVPGFFGWIYYATVFELWAYSAGNP